MRSMQLIDAYENTGLPVRRRRDCIHGVPASAHLDRKLVPELAARPTSRP